MILEFLDIFDSRNWATSSSFVIRINDLTAEKRTSMRTSICSIYTVLYFLKEKNAPNPIVRALFITI